MSPAHRDTGEITAVGRAAEILKQFARSRGALSAAALTQRTGLPKTTVYRMVGELVRVGLLERDGQDYRPGLLFFELGETLPQQRDLREVSRTHLLTLHEATRQNVGLALLDGFDVVHLEVFRGAEGPRLPQHSGGRWPAHASASGKAMLAFMPEEKVVIPDILQRFTQHTIVESGALRDELRRVWRRGVGFDRQEALNGIVGIAAPIVGPDGEVLAAVSMSGVLGRIDTARMDVAVRTTALTISRDLEQARSIVRPVLRRR
ncbi:IclR family transcriptional regulator [Actinomadura syzygii]|uniref:IclR family transcriptional regulator n=1 Tax=Actinomadura syzygii TaxID=1427538 RepID=A0A5D0TTM5_9ACTN|nr:IclR family transcriptional regulator [Actinomadura syzygii]TYC08672.1 IclR family transcriptional regulator [Actinomadura syzygii]